MDYDTPEESLPHVLDLFRRLQRDAHFSIDATLQRDTRGFLAGQIDRAEQARLTFRGQGKGIEANQSLALKSLFAAVAAELDLVLSFKESQPHAAWGALVEAQEEAAAAGRFWEALEEATVQYRQHLDQVEAVMFPKQLFFSPAFLFDESDVECMLCERPYSECDHIAGEPYDGEACRRKIKRIKECVEISIVDEPSAKYRRGFNVGGIDPITGLPYEGSSPEKDS
jgi:hypothetical protein